MPLSVTINHLTLVYHHLLFLLKLELFTYNAEALPYLDNILNPFEEKAEDLQTCTLCSFSSVFVRLKDVEEFIQVFAIYVLYPYQI